MSSKGDSVSRALLSSGRRYVRLLTASFAPPGAILVSGWTIGRATRDAMDTVTASGDAATVPASPELVATVGIGIAVLALGGSLAVWRDHRTILWGVTGSVLLLGLVPFAGDSVLVLVGLLVVGGVGIGALPRAWCHVWFLSAVLLAFAGVGLLAFAHVPGYAAVMVPVNYAILFGIAVSAVGVSDGRSPATAKPLAAAIGDAVSDRSLAPISRDVARWSERRRIWILVALWSIGAVLFHFGGLAAGLYLQYGWWDTTAHAVSGAGVAAILYLLRPGAFNTTYRSLLLLSGLLIVIGSAFEVYEYLFRSYFFQSWTVEHYLRDTMLDLVANTTGAVLFALLQAIGLGGRSR